MRTKNSLELFEQAVASYKLSQCLSKPDNELYHAAFYFALHRFFSGEDFPLERLYETSPEMLFEQFYLYCQKHAEVLTDAKILQRNDPAAGVLLAVVFVQEEKKSARRAACETVLKQRADVSYLKFLGGLAKTYPQLLELMFVLVESKDVWSEIYLSDLLAAYCSRPVKSTEEFAVIYKWLERLADPVAVGKHLPFAVKEIEPDNAFMAFHASHLTALLQLIAAKDGHNLILSKTVLSLITLSNLALKIRLDILNKYAARVYAGSRDNLPHFCAAVSALLKESFLTDDDVCYEILLQFEKAVPENSETALTMLQWAEQAWRSHYLLHDPQGSDFCEDGLWRFAEPVLQKAGQMISATANGCLSAVNWRWRPAVMSGAMSRCLCGWLCRFIAVPLPVVQRKSVFCRQQKPWSTSSVGNWSVFLRKKIRLFGPNGCRHWTIFGVRKLRRPSKRFCRLLPIMCETTRRQ